MWPSFVFPSFVSQSCFSVPLILLFGWDPAPPICKLYGIYFFKSQDQIWIIKVWDEGTKQNSMKSLFFIHLTSLEMGWMGGDKRSYGGCDSLHMLKKALISAWERGGSSWFPLAACGIPCDIFSYQVDSSGSGQYTLDGHIFLGKTVICV